MAKRTKTKNDAASDNEKKDEAGGTTPVLSLPDVLDTSAADDLYALLSDSLTSENGIEIDASDVERPSSPCAQLLIAAGQHQEQRGNLLRIKKMSDEFRGTMVLLGLNEQLEKWSAS